MIQRESIDYEGSVRVPLIPFSTSDALQPEEAFKIAAALRAQAAAYEEAATIAEARAQSLRSLGYRCRPAVRQHDRPYNLVFHDLTVWVRGIPEVEE